LPGRKNGKMWKSQQSDKRERSYLRNLAGKEAFISLISGKGVNEESLLARKTILPSKKGSCFNLVARKM
jgi:hypothetical protein